MNVLKMAVLGANVLAVLGLVLGYVMTPIAAVGTVMLEQVGSPGMFGVIKMAKPERRIRRIFSATVFAFTLTGIMLGGVIGAVIGLALHLPWR